MRERLLAAGLQALGELTRLPEAIRFERAARRPARAQEERLREMIAANADTDFGRKYDLGRVRTIADLRARVPVQTYADIEPFIARQMNGEKRVLSAEDPIFFASSTGTTGKPKRTPVTPRFRQEFQRTVFVSMAHVAARFPAAFSGQALYFVGSRELGRAPCGTPIGFTSGYNFTTLPPLVRRVYAWPYELFEVKDLDARTYLALWLAATRPVTFVAGVFPLALLAMLRAVPALAEPLARDLRNGTLRDDIALSPAERAFFEKLARRDTRAADRIAAGGSVFPHLRLVYCWIGASAGHYVPELRERLGHEVAVRDAIYAANEGWGNVTFGEEELGGPLAITSHVFEFIAENGEELLPHELEVGRRYRILLTTGAGIHRYDLGDIVECTGMYHATPRIRFVRRAGASLSIAGEKLDEAHVIGAAEKALARVGLEAEFFTAVPRFVPSPRWQVAVELRGKATDGQLEALRREMDIALGDAADDYRIYRKSTLGPLALLVVAPGEHERLRREAIASGRPDAQLKVQNLSTDPEEPARAGWRVERVVEV